MKHENAIQRPVFQKEKGISITIEHDERSICPDDSEGKFTSETEYAS